MIHLGLGATAVSANRISVYFLISAQASLFLAFFPFLGTWFKLLLFWMKLLWKLASPPWYLGARSPSRWNCVTISAGCCSSWRAPLALVTLGVAIRSSM